MASISTIFNSEKNVTVFTVSGKVEIPELLTAMQEHYPRLCSRFIIWDFSDATPSRVTIDDFEEIADKTSKLLSKGRQTGKTAIVGSRDIIYGLARMYAVIAEDQGLPFEYSAFRSIASAMQWFGIHQD